MSRRRVSLRPPDPGDDLRGFPRSTLDTRRPVWRVTRDGEGPWWFGSSMEGRFDLPAPDGTCYVAGDDLGAILEVLGPDLMSGGAAPASLLDGRHLRELRVPRKRRLANTLVDKAARWVTAELSTIVPYDLPHAWARAFRTRGFDGVRYGPRHSTSRRRYSCALFGRAGERRRWRKGRAIPIGIRHRERLRSRCGITLFERPAEDELRFARD